MEHPLVPVGLSAESTIRRDREGRWFHEGEEVTNAAVSRAFDRWLGRSPDGRYWLKNEASWAYIELEGAPFFVRRVEPFEDGLCITLSDGSRERLAARTLRQGEDGRLFCQVKGGAFVAQLDRAATLDLEPWVDEDELGIFVAVDGERVRPPIVREPLEFLGVP